MIEWFQRTQTDYDTLKIPLNWNIKGLQIESELSLLIKCKVPINYAKKTPQPFRVSLTIVKQISLK